MSSAFSNAKLRAATAAQIAALKGFGVKKATALHAFLGQTRGHGAADAADRLPA